MNRQRCSILSSLRKFLALNMIATFIFLSILFNTGQFLDINSIEFSPYYDAIIFGDIAEIINDIDSNMNFQTNKKQNSESESDEEVESLLSEYQHYLEKAEKQRVNYFDKTRGKNKVPLLPRERYSKMNIPKIKTYKHPYDLFPPMHIVPGGTLPQFNKIIWNANNARDLSKTIHTTGNDVMLSSCFCEENKFPCKCNCKQCIIPLEKKIGTYFKPSKTALKNIPLTTSSSSYTNTGYFDKDTDEKLENDVNIRIKFDIQMPKIENVLKKIYKNFGPNKTIESDDTDINDNTTPMNISFPALNFPVPLSIFTYTVSKLHKYNPPMHKMSTHKKKKIHTNYQNKKHRSKFLSFHHGKGNSSQNIPAPEIYSNDTHNLNNASQGLVLNIQPNNTTVLEPSANVNISEISAINPGTLNMSAYVNISNEDNLIEVDTKTLNNSNSYYTRSEQHNTTETLPYLRIKREIKMTIIDNDTLSNNDVLRVRGLNISQNEHDTNNKIDNKQLLLDSDLLFWPLKVDINVENSTNGTQILQSNKELNISEYTSNLNTSWHKALTKINWNNVDIATSTFVALVGKHVNGILTFCSDKRCRSLKCTKKKCIDRSCFVNERYNQKGHCSSTPNEPDTTIPMESSLDVSSDIAYELVEALQNQMLGSIYGKATICINIKCITLIANKKMFTKTKCSIKQLNSEGHCESLKIV